MLLWGDVVWDMLWLFKEMSIVGKVLYMLIGYIVCLVGI